MKKTNGFYFSFLTLAAITSCFLAYQYQQKNLLPCIEKKNKKNFTDQYSQKLTQKENVVWELITTHTGVTQEQCLKNHQSHLQQETTMYKKSNKQQLKNAKKLSPKTHQLVEVVLQDFNINPQSIDIIPFKGEGSPAAADDWTLFIDEQDLLSYPLEAQYFILGHELIHIQSQDHSIRCALHRLVPNKNNKNIQSALDSLDHLQETRADTLAMLKGDKYIQGSISFFEILEKREGRNFEIASHPKTSDRIMLAKNIYSLNNDVSIKNNALA